jgi:hypothetical protein
MISRRLWLLLIVPYFCEVGRAAVTIDFLDVPSQISTREKESVFRLRSKGGSLSNADCWISQFTLDHGDPGPLDALRCMGASQLAADKVDKVTLSYPSGHELKRGTYTATLEVLGLDQAGTAVSQTLSLRVIVPAVTLKFADADTLRLLLKRQWPWFAASDTIPVAFHVTSDLQPTIVPFVDRSELYVPAGTVKDIVPGGSIDAHFCSPSSVEKGATKKDPTNSSSWKLLPDFWAMFQSPPPCSEGETLLVAGTTHSLNGAAFEIRPNVPSNLKEATATLHIRSGEFPADMDIPVTLLVKDWWVWAALAVLLGQLLSFVVSNWVNVGRPRRLNKLAMAPVESGVINLLLKKPALVGSSEVAAINTLLNTAAQANRLGEVDAAKDSIKLAQTKLGALSAASGETTKEEEPPRVLLLQTGHAYVHRRLNFMLLNPDAKLDAKTYTWTWTGQKTKDPQLLFAAPGLKDISTEFGAPGLYTITVSIADNTPVYTLTFQVEHDKSLWSQVEIAQSDKAIVLLAVVFAAILAYLAIDRLESFGTVSDYALAFLGGFGFTATTSGFGAVMSGFKDNRERKAGETAS